MTATAESTQADPGTLRAIFLMICAMAGFACADMLIKVSAEHVPASQVLTILGLGGMAIFAVFTKMHGLPLFTRAIFHPAILMRAGSEFVATTGFLLALTILPFATASSILQVTPLLVTLGAAVFLRESVGWRRWAAIGAGLLGVLIILNPVNTPTQDQSGQTLGALLAMVGVIGLAGRDLTTRFVPKSTPTIQIALWGFIAVILAGIVLTLITEPWVMPSPRAAFFLAAMVVTGCVGYLCVTQAMRAGDISAVAPFRYSRIIFAFLLAVIVFGEPLTPQTLIGAAIVVGAGLYTLLREKQRASAKG